MSITIHLSPDLESNLHEQASAMGVPLDQFVVDVLSQRLGQSRLAIPAGASVSAEESKLLEAINRGLSEAVWARYHALVKRRREETLTPAEKDELIILSDTIEAASVVRLKLLQQLARLRGVSLEQLMDQLGIHGSIYG
jgi:hypothetical protein